MGRVVNLRRTLVLDTSSAKTGTQDDTQDDLFKNPGILGNYVFYLSTRSFHGQFNSQLSDYIIALYHTIPRGGNY